YRDNGDEQIADDQPVTQPPQQLLEVAPNKAHRDDHSQNVNGQAGDGLETRRGREKGKGHVEEKQDQDHLLQSAKTPFSGRETHGIVHFSVLAGSGSRDLAMAGVSGSGWR